MNGAIFNYVFFSNDHQYSMDIWAFKKYFDYFFLLWHVKNGKGKVDDHLFFK